MSVARKAAVAFAVVFVISLTAAALVFSLATGSNRKLDDYRTQTRVLHSTLWSLRADFAQYDDDLNAYVAIAAGGSDQQKLREASHQRAEQARTRFTANLERARAIATDPALKTLLDTVAEEFGTYQQTAARIRSAVEAGKVPAAVTLTAVESQRSSEVIMPALEQATAGVDDTVTAALDTLGRTGDRLQVVSVVSAALIALLIGGLAAGVRWIVLSPLTALRARLTEIADGEADLSDRLTVDGDDEVAQVARAFNTMLDTLAAKEHEIAAAQAERERNLEISFEEQRAAEQQVRTRAQAIIDETASSVAVDLAELSNQVDVVRRAATTIDERVTEADNVTREVVTQAREADRVVNELLESLRQVSGMAQLIGGVADQTKLLALNATIEAARAGESGRGFSVVANEVKDLAMTTARSTSEITTTITRLEQNTSEMAETIAAMSAGITGVDGATEALRAVAREQFEVVGTLELRVNDTIQRIDAMTNLTTRLERRQHRRVPATGRVEVHLGGRTLPGDLLDVGEGGLRCQVPADTPLTIEENGSVDFWLTGDPTKYTARMVVRGVHDDKYGLQFVNPPQDLLDRVRGFVDEATGVITFF